ncbi:molybdenum cofactor biosynthesis protein [Perkinsus olseni]|uniref:Molybdenum cofactor biosynthesis protein n=1 Tax=Perkinsus olseni TaxID=32597 RepID=A0A7J6MHY5_PEROL|nr:molybdenum cofactor biosynthesis protein [Perkinsus olseni]
MGESAKGLVALTAQVAGVQAAKKTADLVPLCHNVRLDFADVQLARAPGGVGVHLTSEVACRDATGVEMEALTAVPPLITQPPPFFVPGLPLSSRSVVRSSSSGPVTPDRRQAPDIIRYSSVPPSLKSSGLLATAPQQEPRRHGPPAIAAPPASAARGRPPPSSASAKKNDRRHAPTGDRSRLVVSYVSRSARRRFGEDAFYTSAWYKKTDEDEGSDDAETTAFESRFRGGEASTQGGQRELPRTPRLGRSFRASRIQRSWKLWYFRRAFERYSIDCVGFLASLNWLRKHNMLYGIELADPSDTKHWNAAHRTAPKDSEIDPWGHQRLREHLDRIWNIERDARKRATRGKTEGHSTLVRKRTTPLRSGTAQSGPKVAQPVTLPPKAVLPPIQPHSHAERCLARSLPPPVNRGFGMQASGRIPVGGLGPQAWRIPMPRLELGAPRLSFHPSGAVVPFLAGGPPPPVVGRIVGCGGPPPTAGGGIGGARIRPSQIGVTPAGSCAHHLRPIVPGFPLKA